jgi:hypothetical protein
VQCARFFNNLIDRGGNGCLLGHISGDGKDLVRVTFGDSGKIIASLSNIDRVDLGSAVRKAAFCNAQTNSAVGAGNFAITRLAGDSIEFPCTVWSTY